MTESKPKTIYQQMEPYMPTVDGTMETFGYLSEQFKMAAINHPEAVQWGTFLAGSMGSVLAARCVYKWCGGDGWGVAGSLACLGVGLIASYMAANAAVGAEMLPNAEISNNEASPSDLSLNIPDEAFEQPAPEQLAVSLPDRTAETQAPVRTFVPSLTA